MIKDKRYWFVPISIIIFWLKWYLNEINVKFMGVHFILSILHLLCIISSYVIVGRYFFRSKKNITIPVMLVNIAHVPILIASVGFFEYYVHFLYSL